MPRATGSTLKHRPNVTVVPIRFEQPQNQITSPRNHSKTKLKLVSPSIRNSGTNFKENNPPASLRGESINKRASVQIQLGGKGTEGITHKRNRQSGDLYQYGIENSRDLRSQSRQFMEQSSHKVYRYSGNVSNSGGQYARATSPQRISIHYAPIPQVYQPLPIIHTVQKQMIQKPAASTPLQQSQTTKPKINSNYNLPSELAIKQENTMENLRESYESEMREIKKLQEEITSNNKQIKELLKNSKASKNSGKSKQDIIHKNEDYHENLAESREPSIWAEEQRRQALENAIISKKTLINDLKIQTTNKLSRENSLSSKSNGEVSVQTDNCLPADSEALQEPQKILPKLQRLSLTKNEECQVLIQAYSGRTTEQKEILKTSIIHESNNFIEENQTKMKQVEEQQIITQSRKSQKSQLGKSKRSVVKVSPLKISHHSENKIGPFFEKKQSFKSVEKISSGIDFKETEGKVEENIQCSPIPVSQQMMPNQIPSKQQVLLSQAPPYIPSNKTISNKSSSSIAGQTLTVNMPSAKSIPKESLSSIPIVTPASIPVITPLTQSKSIPKESQIAIPTPPPTTKKQQQPKPTEMLKQMRKISNRIYL